MTRSTCLLVLVLSVPALAQGTTAPVGLTTPPAPPAEMTRNEVQGEVPPPVEPVKDISVSVQLAINVGLVSVDVQVKRFYAFTSGNVGVPLLSNGLIGAFAIGTGYTFALSQPGDSMWFMDLFGLANPGWMSGAPFLGIGAGLGLRFLHRSGFTMGFKLPLLGGVIGANQSGTAAAVGYFFLANAIALPVVSFGYRF
jgi:hypothetical protein